MLRHEERSDELGGEPRLSAFLTIKKTPEGRVIMYVYIIFRDNEIVAMYLEEASARAFFNLCISTYKNIRWRLLKQKVRALDYSSNSLEFDEGMVLIEGTSEFKGPKKKQRGNGSIRATEFVRAYWETKQDKINRKIRSRNPN